MVVIVGLNVVEERNVIGVNISKEGSLTLVTAVDVIGMTVQLI